MLEAYHVTGPIRIAFSPDSDDIFMFHAMLSGKVDTQGFTFDVVRRDTEALNEMAERADVDIIAVSVARYASLTDRYLLLPHGASVGRGYGPAVVASQPAMLQSFAKKRIGVPGKRTTAFLVLSLLLADFEPVVIPIVPHERVFEALRAKEVDAALIIHEGRLTFEREGFVLVADVGVEWEKATGLPLPLGVNLIRRGLGAEAIARLSNVCRASIEWALAHREDVLSALQHEASIEPALLDRYLSMYANADTVKIRDDVRVAIEELFRRGRAAGILLSDETHPVIELAP